MRTVPVPPGVETEIFVLGRGALADVGEVLAKNFPGRRPWIVADGNTWRVAGERLARMLAPVGGGAGSEYAPRVFPGSPVLHPDSFHADELARAMPADAVPVAVGSGVINDLVKRAAGLREAPYCCVPTAASVDGYTSFGAALSVDGFKKTMPCPAPRAVVADVDVLETAPPEMLSAGYADLAAKITGGADWLIADAMGEEAVDAAVWELVQKDLRAWLADPHDLGPVFHGLAATGYAMQMHRSSRPASGAEHLFSHIWEMEGLTHNGEDVSHGFKVGVGTLATTRLMEFAIGLEAADARRLAVPGVDRAGRVAEIDALMEGDRYGADVRTVALAKFLEGPALAERRGRIWDAWDEIRLRLRRQLIPSAELSRMLAAAGCPVTPDAIGLGAEQFRHAIHAAQLIRNRYTIIDLLYEAGLLRRATDALPVG